MFRSYSACVCGMRLSVSPDSDGFTIHDHEGVSEFRIGHLCEKSPERLLRFLNSCRPDTEPNDSSMGTDRKGPLVGEIFIECHNDCLPGLCPGEEYFVGSAGEFDVRGVVDGP